MASPPPLAAPGWRRESYRAPFALGAALAIFAVLPFVSRGAGGGALGLFHPLAQVEGFLSCFLVGFLFTFVPRWTQTKAPAAWEMTAALALPAACVVSAWAGRGALAHGLWLGLAAVVLQFTIRRARAARAQPVPAVLVWVPLAILAGAAGALLSALAPLFAATSAPRAWIIGRGLLAQGFVAGLVLGVSGILVPRLTRGESAPDARDPARLRHSAVLHALAALAFFGSFPIEVLVDARIGMALRAVVATGVLVLAAGIHRAPTLPGVHRQLLWIAAWLVPRGILAGRARAEAAHRGAPRRLRRRLHPAHARALRARRPLRRRPRAAARGERLEGACRRGAHRARVRRAPARRDRRRAHPVLAGGRRRRVRGRDPRLGGAGPTRSPGRRPVVLEEQARRVLAGAEAVEDRARRCAPRRRRCRAAARTRAPPTLRAARCAGSSSVTQPVSTAFRWMPSLRVVGARSCAPSC